MKKRFLIPSIIAALTVAAIAIAKIVGKIKAGKLFSSEEPLGV